MGQSVRLYEFICKIISIHLIIWVDQYDIPIMAGQVQGTRPGKFLPTQMQNNGFAGRVGRFIFQIFLPSWIFMVIWALTNIRSFFYQSCFNLWDPL